MRWFRQWWQRQTGDVETPLGGDAPAFAVSFVVHLCVIVSLGFVPMAADKAEVTIAVSSIPMQEPDALTLPEEFKFSDLPSEEIGSSSVQGELAALSMAPVVSPIATVPSRLETMPVENARIEINDIVQVASGLHYASNLAVKGAAGEGTTGAVGAIDRITHEILLSLEERKTLIVWLFDATESLVPQRKAIRDRFAKIYQELGIIESTGNESFAKHENKPLLSTVVAFGNSMKFVTEKPTDNLAELKRAVMEMPKDESGIENVFTAIFEAAKRYASYRYTTPDRPNPERNVMIVVFTDEAGSDATNRSEETIKMCRRLAIPVYVIGVPAPFGLKETEMKWIDPDPRFNQDDQWAVVEQGPETLLPERIKLSFASGADEAPLDSGFGPYALTRLCSETGGIYFAVHPNRKIQERIAPAETAAYSGYLAHFFDPEVMRRYRPEYVSITEYQKRKDQNKARSALIEAAARSEQVGALANPQLRFVKNDDAEFARALSTAQQAAAALEPKINELFQLLQRGEGDRDKETIPRWQAGYDLAMGRILAAKVRTETYNAMLATAKRGLKPRDAKNNTWELQRSDDISAGSTFVKLAERARMYLNRVKNEHAGTPWAMLAQQELDTKLGWTWKDSFTPPPKVEPKMANNNPPPRPQAEQKVMLQKSKPKRDPPKL